MHTELAGPLIDDQRSALEDGLYRSVLRIEVVQGHEVAKKPVEVTEHIEEFVNQSDVIVREYILSVAESLK